MATQTKDQAQKAAEEHPDAWIAVEEGDSITGPIVDVTMGWSDQKGADYPILIIKTADGTEKKVHCFSTVLYNEAVRQRPIPGEVVTITYLGVGEPRVRGQNGAKRYSFRIEGRSAAQVESMYDRMAGQGLRPATQPQVHPAPVAAPFEDEIPF